MKNSIIFLSFFASLFFFTNSAVAQQLDYGSPEANALMAKADRMISSMNKRTGTFNQQEMKLYDRAMRGDTRAAKQFTQRANAKTQRLDNSIKQYNSYYNQNWVNSFNTFNSGYWKKVNGNWYWVK